MMKFHFLHTYKLVDTIRINVGFLPATYEDWACINNKCSHIIRRKILNPPKRRIKIN